MFEPKITKPQTKTAASTTNKVAPQHSVFGTRPFGGSTVDQAHFLQRKIGNQATLRLMAHKTSSLTGDEHNDQREQEAEPTSLAPRGTTSGVSWDFSKIPPFPPDRAHRSIGGVSETKDRMAAAASKSPAPSRAAPARAAQGAARLSAPAGPAAAPAHAWDFGAVAIHAAPPAAREDANEAEADRIAERAARTPAEGNGPGPPGPPSGSGSGGQPLDPAARRRLAPLFGFDLGRVRIHADAGAARSAAAHGARAYALGDRILFAAGQYAPRTAPGLGLLAHEIAHVGQQLSGRAPPGIQRKPGDKPPGAPKKVRLRLKGITRPMTEAELTHEFVRQYYGYTDEQQISSKLALWTNNSHRGTTPDEVAKGYVDVTVNTAFQTDIGTLAPVDRASVDAETDRQFYEATGIAPGTKITGATADRGKADQWLGLRNAVLTEDRQIKELPEPIKAALFAGGVDAAVASRADYPQLLRIAAKLEALTPAELEEYKSRVTASTTELSVYEESVDRFIQERKTRGETVRERRTIETRLYNLLGLYQRYRSYLSMLTTNAALAGMGASNPQAAGASLGAQPTLNTMRTELQTDLVAAGFPGGIADFEALIHQYEAVFERETLAIAKVMLDQYEHVLWVQEQGYRKSGAADGLYCAVSGTKAAADYDEGDKIRSEHAMGVVLTPDEMSDQAYWVGQRNAARGRGDAKIRSLATDHPLVTNTDFDRERLARSPSAAGAQSVMLDYIAARRQDIAETRKNIAGKPAMIYGLDTLISASLQLQNIQPGTLSEKIVRDHISDVHWTEAIPKLILAVVAVSAGLLTGGGGALAVLAAGTALGIGAYQALDEFRQYEIKSAAYGAQLTSDDPTFAWVIVAVIGAGFDAAALASVLPKLRPAIQAFNAGAEAGDVAKLTQKLEQLTGIEENIRKSVIRAAEAEVEARAAWKAILRPPAALRAVVIPGAEEFGRFVYAVYLSVKRGVREFQVFVKTNEAIELIGDVAKLTPEELALLKTGYLKSIAEMETVAARGASLGLTAGEVEAFMRIRANAKGMTVEQLVKDMEAWKATAQGGTPARALGKSSLIVDENVMIALERQAAGKPLQPGEQALLNNLKALDTSDLRVPGAVGAKGAATLEQFNITVSRTSAEYKAVLSELEKFNVGRTKGFEDRQIVADAFFSKADPGVKPVLVTHDKGIYNRLLLITGQDPAKLGKSVPLAFPAGFDVTVGGRTITVLPLPGS